MAVGRAAVGVPPAIPSLSGSRGVPAGSVAAPAVPSATLLLLLPILLRSRSLWLPQSLASALFIPKAALGAIFALPSLSRSLCSVLARVPVICARCVLALTLRPLRTSCALALRLARVPLNSLATALPDAMLRAPVLAAIRLSRLPPSRALLRSVRVLLLALGRTLELLDHLIVPVASATAAAALVLALGLLDGPRMLDGRPSRVVRRFANGLRQPPVLALALLAGAALSASRHEGLRRAVRFNAGMIPMALDYHMAQWLYLHAPAGERRAHFAALHEKHKLRPLRLILSLGGFYVKIGQVKPCRVKTCRVAAPQKGQARSAALPT